MVSTQTTLTCSRSDSLLPHSLLYNIITSKLTEAFELTNLHAKVCDYKDNLSTIKKEPGHVSCRFTSNFPERPHFDLLSIPTISDSSQSNFQDHFSPNSYTPKKRQRLNSSVTSPVIASIRDTLGLRTPTSKHMCNNCQSSYRTGSALASHIKRCSQMVYKTPLTHVVCKELRYNVPENSVFDTDIPVINTKETSSGKEDNKSGAAKVSQDCIIEQSVSDTSKTACKEQCNLMNTKVCQEKKVVRNDIPEKGTNLPRRRNESKLKSGLDDDYHAPIRRSNRVNKKTKRQVVSKMLLDRIKNINKTKPKARRNVSNKNVSVSKTRRKAVSSDKSDSENAKKKLKIVTGIKVDDRKSDEKISTYIKHNNTESEKNRSIKPFNINDVAKVHVTNKCKKDSNDININLKCEQEEDKEKAKEKLVLNESPMTVINTNEESALELNSKEERVNESKNNKIEKLPPKNNHTKELKGLVSFIKPETPATCVSTKAEVTSEELINHPDPAKYSCDNCRCKFQSSWSARRHNYTVHGIGTPLTSDDLLARQSGTECTNCTHSYPSDATPTLPEIGSGGGKDVAMWVCGVCGVSFEKRMSLVEHRKVHEGGKPPKPQPSGLYKCMVCGAVHPTHIILIKHIGKKHNPALTCDTCYQMFPSALQLKSHNCGSDVMICCRHCPRKFKSSSAHSKHMKSSHSSLTLKLDQSACRLCDYTFSSIYKYKVHQSIAHPTPDMKCQVCDVTWESRDQLTAHILAVHKEVSPFLCTVCEEGFKSHVELVTHRSQHFK